MTQLQQIRQIIIKNNLRFSWMPSTRIENSEKWEKFWRNLYSTKTGNSVTVTTITPKKWKIFLAFIHKILI